MPVDYHAWTHRPKSQGGTDPIEQADTAWIAVYDDLYLGMSYSSADGQAAMEFPYIDFSDNALTTVGGPFSYDHDGSIYTAQIEQEGLYAITVACASESLNAAKDYKFRVGLGVNGDYPGRNASDVNLWSMENVLNQDFSTGYLYFERTWVLPIKIIGSPPEQIVPLVSVQLATTETAPKSWTLRNRMWITYLGPTNYAATSFINSNDPGAM